MTNDTGNWGFVKVKSVENKKYMAKVSIPATHTQTHCMQTEPL